MKELSFLVAVVEMAGSIMRSTNVQKKWSIQWSTKMMSVSTHYTEWKFHDFAITKILREIDVWDYKSHKCCQKFGFCVIF